MVYIVSVASFSFSRSKLDKCFLIPNTASRVRNYCTMFVLIDVIVLWETDVALCMFCSTFVKIHVSAALEICVSQLCYEATISLRRPMVK